MISTDEAWNFNIRRSSNEHELGSIANVGNGFTVANCKSSLDVDAMLNISSQVSLEPKNSSKGVFPNLDFMLQGCVHIGFSP